MKSEEMVSAVGGRDAVRQAWMRDRRAQYASDDEADKAFEAHWVKVQGFLKQLEDLPTYVVPRD